MARLRPGAPRAEAAPPPTAPSELITLMVRREMSSGSRPVYCTVRRTETMQVVMDRYYACKPAAARREGAFMFDGHRMLDTETAAELELEDGDEIVFLPHMVGS